MKEPKSRSPIKKPPLRHAGQSLDDEIERLINEKAVPHYVAATLLVVFAAYEWVRWYFRGPPHPMVLTIIAIAGIAFAWMKILRIRDKVRRLRLGRDGERSLGQFLEPLRQDGYRVFHDILGKDFNLDHVLVGPAGVFTIETKTRSKPLRGETKIFYDGEHVSIMGMGPDRDPIIQAKAQASWLRSLIKESAERTINVRPIVIYLGWFVERTSPNPKTEVWVLNENALPSFIRNEKQVLSLEDIALISDRLSIHVRATQKERA